MAEWTEELDRLLLERRRDKKLPWRSVCPVGPMGKTRCQKRFEFLMSGAPRPAARAAVGEPAVVDKRDGLEWLASKQRLSVDQLAEARRYRKLFRDGGPITLRSCINVQEGGAGVAGPKGYADRAVVASSDARHELAVIRYQVLRGQNDMLTAVDGVCGQGWTLRYLAKGDQGRSRELEALLKAALDLIVAWRDSGEIAA